MSSIDFPAPSIVIDCATCVMRCTSVCNDCVVTAVLDRRPDEAVVFDLVEFRAVRLLADAGLLPSLQHREVETSASTAGRAASTATG